MRAIVTFLIAGTVLAAAVQARPDVSLGYKYNTARDMYAGATPLHSADSFGSHGAASTGQHSAVEFGLSSTADYSSSSSASYLGSSAGIAHDQQFNTGSGSSYSASSSSGPTVSSGASIVSTSSANYAPLSYSNTGSGSSSISVGGSAASAASTSTHHSDDSASLPPIITKSFYFEAAPEEPEEDSKPRFVNIGRAQKNYKVIFIKAPTYGLNSQVIPVLPQNEEKTIIYVLSKKPELNQNIELPQAPTTEPSKPEIFFVKYKSEQEALDAQHKIKHVYETNQPSVVGDAHFNDDGHIHSIVRDAVPSVYSAVKNGGLKGGQQHVQFGQHQQQQKQLITAALGQRFGGDEEDQNEEISQNQNDEAQLAIRLATAQADEQVQQHSSSSASDSAAAGGGFNVITEVVRDSSASAFAAEQEQLALQQALSQAGFGQQDAAININEHSDLLTVNYVDLNNAAAVGTAAAAVHGEHGAQNVSVISETEAEAAEFLPPNHEHQEPY